MRLTVSRLYTGTCLLKVLRGKAASSAASKWGNSPRFFYWLRQGMNYTEVAVVPAAFALLTAMFMFGGRTKRPMAEASHTAAGVLVGFFLLSALVFLIVAFFKSVTALF